MVIDTHVFLWYCLDDPKLPAPIREHLKSNPGQVWVPSICLWEIVCLAERKRIAISAPDPGRAILHLFHQTRFKEATLTSEIAILSRSLPFTHEDPADRFIGATAVAMCQTLATSDSRLRDLPFVSLAY